MKDLFALVLMFFAIVVIANSASYAEEKTIEEALMEENEKPKTIEEKIREFEMEIVDNFYKTCSNSNMSRYHDCRCMSIRYLDEYKKSLGKKNHAAIVMDISDECPDKVALAGQSYSMCKSSMATLTKNYDEFCSCVANKFADRMAKKLNVSIQYQVNINSEVYKECGYGQIVTKHKKITKETFEAGQRQSFFPSIENE